MERLLLLQLLVSFVVGGGVIALQSLIAEHVSARFAGIILSFPSTVALGFFFLGWALSPEVVADVVPATFLPLGISALFPAVYAYTALFLEVRLSSRALRIFLSFLMSTLVWLLFSIPVAVFALEGMMIGLVGYFMFILLSYWILSKKHYKKPPALRYSTPQKLLRGIFAGSVIALVVLLGKTLSPFWGGVFTMFPAALSSSMMIIHWYYPAFQLFPTVQRFPVGSLSLLTYSLTAMLVFPTVGFIWGTLIAYLPSLLVSLVLSSLPHRSKPPIVADGASL